MASRSLPKNLTHKPVYALDYENLDEYVPTTDAQWISVGWSTWDPRALALKIFRWTGNKWSRESEEVPLARLIDAAIWVILVVVAIRSASSPNQLPGPVSIKSGVFIGQSGESEVSSESSPEGLADAQERIISNERLHQRIEKLTDLLVQLRAEGRV